VSAGPPSNGSCRTAGEDPVIPVSGRRDGPHDVPSWQSARHINRYCRPQGSWSLPQSPASNGSGLLPALRQHPPALRPGRPVTLVWHPTFHPGVNCGVPKRSSRYPLGDDNVDHIFSRIGVARVEVSTIKSIIGRVTALSIAPPRVPAPPGEASFLGGTHVLCLPFSWDPLVDAPPVQAARESPFPATGEPSWRVDASRPSQARPPLAVAGSP